MKTFVMNIVLTTKHQYKHVAVLNINFYTFKSFQS